MSSRRYTDAFKLDAVRQVIDRGFKVLEVAERLRVTTTACMPGCANSASLASCSVPSWTRASRFGA
ncbi:transposase [Xanthomonas albilineans]|uniref:transposase n=1 Tax=Xanthomonas albilineans TaxID=29447 RepID=UPI003CCCD1F7